MIKDVTINGETWRVRIDDSELVFHHLARIELTEADGWLWRDWGGGAADMVEELFACHTQTRVPPLVLRSRLLEASIELIKSNRLSFFFFEATTPQLGRIYSGMMSQLLDSLGGEWKMQQPEPTWFFFNREDLF